MVTAAVDTTAAAVAAVVAVVAVDAGEYARKVVVGFSPPASVRDPVMTAAKGFKSPSFLGY